MSELAKLYVTVRANAAKLGPDLSKVKSMIGSVFSGIGRMVSGMMKKVFSPWTMLAGGLGAYGIIQQTATFGQEMAKSLAIMKDSGEYEVELRQLARQTAKELGMSHSEAAKSYFYLASAGLDAQKSLKAMPLVATFAAAGAFDMATATDLLTDSLSALGKSSDDAREYAKNLEWLGDVIVKSNTLANASVQQFAEALTEKSAGAMATFNMEAETGIAVLAALADRGRKGAVAGTEFSMVLQAITQTAVSNAEAYEKYNVKVYEDGTGALRSMIDIIADFERALGSMGDEAKTAALQEMGISRGAKAVMFQLLGTTDRMRFYREELLKAGGITETLAEKNLATLAGSLKKLKSTLADLAISVGQALQPIIEKACQRLRTTCTARHGGGGPRKTACPLCDKPQESR